MNQVRYGVSISLDGYVAGKDQSGEHPLGVHGELLHEWMRELAVWRAGAGLEGGVTNASTAVFVEDDAEAGAVIMGRNMFGGGPGPWPEPAWNGWWGEDPPFHLPVFVLTHHPRPMLRLEGGTTFTFVTDGVASALAQARRAAAGRDIAISGGGSVGRQFLAAGLIDELDLHLVPVLLGGGVSLFGGDAPVVQRFTQVRAIEAPGVTHLRYRAQR